MLSFKCAHCGKSYTFKFLPIPDSGAEFKCSACGKNCRLMKKSGMVFCYKEEKSASAIQSSTVDLSDRFGGGESDEIAPEDLEARLQGMLPDLPYDSDVAIGIVKGADNGTTIPVRKPIITIGKSGCDINLNDSDVSQEHCRIEIFGHQMMVLRDLRSVGGTFKNDYPCVLSYLRPGDRIQIGKTELVVLFLPKKNMN